MKKTLALFLSALMLVTLISCGSTELTEPTDVSTQEGSTDTSKTNFKTQTESTIDETVLFDENGIKITAKSLDASGIFGPSLKLLIENDSGKNLTFQTRDASVNGYMVGTIFSADVANGKKANEDLIFSSSGLENAGIETIADMEFSFHIFDSDNFIETFADTAPIVIKTSAFEGYEYKFDDNGTLAYEGNNMKLVIKGLKEGGLLGSEVLVYIENNNDRAVTVQTRDSSVNGFMVTSVMSENVCPGKHAVASITFLSSELEENGIEKIENAELSFHVFDTDSFATLFDTDPITINF